MSSSPESLDSICFEFNDVDPPADTTVRPVSDVVFRQLIRRQLLSEQVLRRPPEDLARMLTLVQEQGQSCRQRGDLAGLASCLGNEALLRKARGELNQALELHHAEEQLCRRLNDLQGVVLSLIHQAFLLAQHLDQPQSALARVEEASQLASQSGRTDLLAQTQSASEAVRRRDGHP